MKVSLGVGWAALAGMGALVLGGCFLNDSGERSPGRNANLVLSVGVKDVNNLAKNGLGKTSAITLNKLIITLTSSVGGDAVIRDTILADTGASFVSTSTLAQQVSRIYGIKPLRNWTIQVKTLDVNDSVIHLSSQFLNNVRIGELRQVQLNLSARYVVYAAKISLPDSIGSQTASQKQKLYVNRFVMVVDGDTVRDTTSSPGYFAPFLPDSISHLVVWDYVRADTAHTLGLYVYADSLGSWDPGLPVYGKTIQISSTDTTYTPELPWTGPGSASDPACQANPGNCGGSRAGLQINLGAVGLVNIAPTINPNPLPKR